MNAVRLFGLVLVAGSALHGGASMGQRPELRNDASDGCLPSGNGYLRARMRGALNLDIDWRNADLTYEGGPRPDRSGVRLSFAGPPQSDGRRMRFVFGVRVPGEGGGGRALPTNLTVIFDGEN